MRKVLTLLVLVPFATVVVLSCDDHPTAPEEVQAATTVQESSAPQASKQPPTLPMPVVLSGWTLAVADEQTWIPDGALGASTAWCPEGKIPVAGGFAASAGNWTLVDNRPTYNNATQQAGWKTSIRNDDDGSLPLRTYASCVDGSISVE